MNFRTIAASLVALLAFESACAAQKPSKLRMDAIWSAIDSRVSSQVDIWYEDGDFPNSIGLLVFEARYAPSDYEIVTNLAWMQENIEEWDSALATYKLYRENNPQDPDRALGEADYYFRKKQYAEVPPLLEPVLKQRPHPNNFRILAHAYEKLTKYKDAERVWKAYIAQDPADLSAQANLRKVEKKLVSNKVPVQPTVRG